MMQFAAKREIEYLSGNDRVTAADTAFIHEMARRLDALRRYDQHFSDADWRPRRPRNGRAGNGDSAQT
jgi:hypothetical protein